MRWFRFTGAVAPLTGLTAALLAIASASAGQLDTARACTGLPLRLERLACFDAAFETPLTVPNAGKAPGSNQTERWRQAFAQALESHQVVYRDTGELAGHMVTVPALGARPPRPLLVLQCDSNITELSLMLPHPLTVEQVSVDYGAGMRAWRVRDEGLRVSSGRGLPAIEAVKRLAATNDVTLRANHSELDGLVFDLSGFSAAIRPLRLACGW